jgi:serine/threonine-protein kinase
VADFGVARALAEAAWTEPAGAMVGTARYISPESAEGKTVDGRADVYSLALVLYEAVSGTVPFVADTTMGTLMARVGATLPPHPSLGPLDEVLARAAAPDASARLDAAGFAARLGALASALPTPEPLPLLPPQHDAPAPISGFRAPNVEELTQVATPGAAGTPVGTKAGPGELFDAEVEGSRTSHGAPIAPAAAPPRGRRRMPWVIALVALVVLLAAGGLVALQSHVFTPSHPVPSLVNLTQAQARAAIAQDHFTLEIEPAVKSTTVGNGSILSQSPKAGTSLKQGSVIKVVPSAGPPPVTVPSLAGLTCAQATAQLAVDHLKASCAPAQYNATIDVGQLIDWTFGSTNDPTSAPYGATIALVPSAGHAPVQVPPIPTTYSFAQAQAALTAVGLTATQATATSTTVAAGDVISAAPAGGATVPYGSAVTVTVSTGPPTTTVPNLFKDTVAEATAALQAANLTVGGAYGPSAGSSNAFVIYSSPAQGTTVPDGTSVSLYTD